MPSAADVVVVGAGVAGLAAAIDAANAGLRVVVVEAFAEPGGAAETGSALTCVVDTPLQRTLGIQDSVELALRDWIVWGGVAEVDAGWARAYLERSRADVYDWLEALGVEWSSVIQTEGNSVPRQHQPAGGGAAVMAHVLAAAVDLPIEWRLATTVVELVLRDGAVAGVVAERGPQREQIDARAVLLATGGFAGNPSLLAKFGPKLSHAGPVLVGGAEQATGRGHELASAAGADLVGLERIWTYAYGVPDPADPSGQRGLALWLTGDIWLNGGGRRFHDESQRGGASATPALLRQPGATSWSIFDAREAGRIEIPHPRYRRDDGSPDRVAIEHLLSSSPAVARADSVEALARATGLPRSAFAATIAEVRSWEGGTGVDPHFGRPLDTFRPLREPPFYAVRFRPLARKCLGGVRTDRDARVLRPDGSIVDRLYAAGELAGMGGGHMNGLAGLEGTMFGPSLFSGRIAARAIARARSPQSASESLSSARRSG